MKLSEAKPGALVRLKSGGPIMTIGRVNLGIGAVACQWFSNGEVNDDLFWPETLDEFGLAPNAVLGEEGCKRKEASE